MKAETIVAVATPAGRGGVGVVRVSGAAAGSILQAIGGVDPAPRRARLVVFRDADGTSIDRGLALWFPAPHSFTGDDVLELQAHGSPIVLEQLVRRACELGARPARAGEFSERAFLNGKLDLTQAEAVADLIAARSEAQMRAALRSLDGAFSRRVESLARAIVRLRVEVEAAIDFSEEASEGAAGSVLQRLFTGATARLDELLVAARQGVRLTDGLHAVIVGKPNVGKSSLLNALAGSDRAIVTAAAGTTRDVLREAIHLDGIELTLADTAGLRESADEVEAEGIRRARAELTQAGLVLQVVEHDDGAASSEPIIGAPAQATRIVVVNKIDLAHAQPGRSDHNGVVTVALSARTGAGLDLLREELRRTALGAGHDGVFSARARHVVALQQVGTHLGLARQLQADAATELVAEELRLAQQQLGTITGEFTNDDLLGAIFSTFCIGK